MINSNGGIQNRTIRKSTQMVMENCLLDDAKPKLSEATSYFYNGMNGQPETPSSTDGQNYMGITMPLIRRVFPALVAHHICGIQPMTGPVGKCFMVSAKANGSYTDRTKTPTVGYAAGTAELGSGIVDSQYSGSYATSAAEMLGETGGYDAIKQANLSISAATCTAKSRKLAGQYTDELSDDFFNIHNVHLREEIIDILGSEIIAEIDEEILGDIRSQATSGQTFNWSAQDGRWEMEKNANLVARIQREASRIAQTTQIGAGNIIVASTGVCSALRTLSSFTVYPQNKLEMEDIANTTLIGTLNGNMKIFQDSKTNVEQFLVGLKGAGTMRAGYFYLPYIPIRLVEARSNTSFQPAVAVSSRYATYAHPWGVNKWFRSVKVTNLPV